MKSELDRLTEAPGILAAIKIEAGQAEMKAGEGDLRRWQPLLTASSAVLEAARTEEIKITLNDHTVVMVQSGTVILGVVVVKSHPVVKSLKRMLRRTFKRLGATRPSTSPRPVAPDPAQQGMTPSVTRPLGGLRPNNVPDTDKNPFN